MSFMKAKTVTVPGLGPTQLLFGPGRIVIADRTGTARIELQGYTPQELTASEAEGRRPDPLFEVSVELSGADFDAFKAASPAFVAAVVGTAWQVALTDPFFADAQDVP